MKIERPKTLFGRHPLLEEQALIVSFHQGVAHGVLPIIPEEIAPYSFGIVEKISREKRQETAFKWLLKAKKSLEELGV
jgi:hypothetical protein